MTTSTSGDLRRWHHAKSQPPLPALSPTSLIPSIASNSPPHPITSNPAIPLSSPTLLLHRHPSSPSPPIAEPPSLLLPASALVPHHYHLPSPKPGLFLPKSPESSNLYLISSLPKPPYLLSSPPPPAPPVRLSPPFMTPRLCFPLPCRLQAWRPPKPSNAPTLLFT